MLPTFPVFGDILVTDKSYRRGGQGRGKEIKVGDVVQFDSVYEPGEKVIKRVVGMPGDYVLMNTPGSRNEDMVQVRGAAVGMLGRRRKLMLCDRCRKATVGWLETICATRSTQGCGDHYPWD